MHNLWQAYVLFWKKYVDVHSLSTRTEFWTPTIVNAVILGLLNGANKSSIISIVFELAIIIPSISVFIRRMHDAGASAKLFWMGLIPVAGIFFRWVYFLIELLPSNYYNSTFFAWKDRKQINKNATLTWLWTVSWIMTIIMILLEIMVTSAILGLLAMLNVF